MIRSSLLIKEFYLVDKYYNYYLPKQKIDMSKFKGEQIRELMDIQENIRNMSVIAHVDHGKSTLTDALVCKAGLISEEKAGEARWTDKDQKEKDKGITIKSTGVSMVFDHKENGGPEKQYLINLIDSPGHVDFSSEVTAALRVTDGALVVVDTVEGVCVQTQTVLRQAMQERIKPTLMINKVDRAILQLQQEGEQIYQNFVKVIDMVNVIVSTYQNQVMGDITLDPIKGNVAFGAGKDQWAFTLSSFAKIYSQKFGISEEKMKNKLWGDNYFDEEAKKWKIEPISDSGKPLKRTFVQFIIDPICKLIRSVQNHDNEKTSKMLEKIGIKLTEKEKGLEDKKLMKAIMSKWIPAADCIIDMVIKSLPSPIEAQKYRAQYLYEGEEEEVLQAIKNCDPKGPVMVYISKMVAIDDQRFAAFGRVFSGTIATGQKVKIIGPNYKEGSKNDYFEKSISSTMVMIGDKAEKMPSIVCGNTIAITGIDQYLLKSGTISSIQTKLNNSIRPMKYSVSPVFKVAVKPANAMDLPKLIEGLRKLVKVDPLVQWIAEETGENIVAACGELHMEICLDELKKYTGKEIIVSEPIVSYRQTILEKTQESELVKSNNKKNRFYGFAEPIDKKLVEMIESGQITIKDDPKARGKILQEQFDWNKDDVIKIWSFGPEDNGANILVDQIKGRQYINEVKDSLCSAFQWASKEGALAGENMRGIRFNLTDGQVHEDPAHRKGAQVVPCARRLYHGLQLKSRPTLQEPILMCEITAPGDAMGGIYQTLNQRRGNIIEEIQLDSSLSIIKAHLPVAASYGFTEDLRGNTQGKAFPQCIFSHWENISGVPYEDAKGTNLVMDIRKRKGLKEELPDHKDLLDKL